MEQGFKVAAAFAALAAICVWVGHAHYADDLIDEAIAKEGRAARASQPITYPCEAVVVQSLPSGRDPSYGCYSRIGK